MVLIASIRHAAEELHDWATRSRSFLVDSELFLAELSTTTNTNGAHLPVARNQPTVLAISILSCWSVGLGSFRNPVVGQARITASRQNPRTRLALALPKKRVREAGLSKLAPPGVRRTTLDDLAELVLDDYENNRYDTRSRREDAFNHLCEFRGGDVGAEDISTQ